MQFKVFVVTIVVGMVLFGGGLFILRDESKSKVADTNVTIVDGKQIIDIAVKGGYSPHTTLATANMPTIVRFGTKGTFDCSSVVRIPSMGITKNLPSSGTTDIDIGSQPVGIFTGTCGMGMYSFVINFR